MKRFLLPILLGIILILSACTGDTGKPSAAPTPGTSSSATPSPTAPPTPTSTPSPTPGVLPVAPPVWGSVVTDCIQTNPSDTTVTLLTGSFTLPRIENSSGVPAYEVINDWYSDLAAALKDDAMAAAAQAIDDYNTATALGSPFSPYSNEEIYEVKYESPQMAAILRTHYGHMDSPYPTLLYMVDRFNLSNGRALAFSDFFNDPVQAEAIVSAEVFRQGAARTEYDQSALKTAFDRERFYPTEEGLLFFYQPQALAPNAAKMPEFLVPYSLLEGLLVSWA